MANSKISALTSATTPLAGTETLPVVQSSTTKQVSVANLTAGRAVSGLTFQSTQATGTAPFTVASTTNVANLNASSLNGATFASPGAIGSTTPSTGVFTQVTVNSAGYMLKFFNSAGTTARGYIYNNGGGIQFDTEDIGLPFSILNGGYETVRVTYSNVTFYHSNLVQGTAGQGINFTANTPASGMTSQLLNWYEEGTWTPNQGAGLTVVGAFSSTGIYTRIGRQVTVTGRVTGATSINTSGSGIVCTNLPFTVGTNSNSVGAMTNTATNNTYVYVNPSTTTMYSSTIAGASGSLYFTVTYSV